MDTICPIIVPAQRDNPFAAPIRLAEGGLAAFDPAKHPTRPMTIRCDAGIVWITQTASAQDIVLAAGESMTMKPAGKVVVQPLSKSAIIRALGSREPMHSSHSSPLPPGEG